MMKERVFKRKLYEKMLQWKRERNGATALLIKGARRVGKSTIAEEFAKREYESYILIDFVECKQEVKDLFTDISDLDRLFLRLQFLYDVQLIERKSVIIFDEVQNCPLARQAILWGNPGGKFGDLTPMTLPTLVIQLATMPVMTLSTRK
jgi:predicted AAA+ superfamily ATPase